MCDRNSVIDNVKIRSGTMDDMKSVADMIQELADFEKMSNGPLLSVKDLERDGFEYNPPLFESLVAELPDRGVVGYAIYFPTYSTWQGRAMMLEDLYVKPAVRNYGIGRKLFNAVADEAVRRGCCRMDFHVLSWNPARIFYAARGAVDLTRLEKWALYRMERGALKSAAEQHRV